MRRHLIAILSIGFVLGIACPVAFAQEVIPGSVLHLDAVEQRPTDRAWTNLGLAGGTVPAALADQIPHLRDGRIKIPEVEFSRQAKWYVAKDIGQGFTSTPGKAPKLKLKDWTVECLAKRNGPKWPGTVVAAQFAGFRSREINQDDFPIKVQGFRILMHGGDTGKLTGWIKGKKSAKGKWFGADKVGIDIDEGEWHWIAFVFTNQKTLETYQDGKKMGTIETDQNFDGEEPMSVTIFNAWSQHAFNGAISIVRIYDRALSEKEINRNITGDLAVHRANKLATTWAEVKAR